MHQVGHPPQRNIGYFQWSHNESDLHERSQRTLFWHFRFLQKANAKRKLQDPLVIHESVHSFVDDISFRYYKKEAGVISQ